MRKVVLGLGISIEGYIARLNGAVDFFFMPKTIRWLRFLDPSASATMGKKRPGLKMAVRSAAGGRIDKLMRTLSSWPALIIATVYFGLIIGLLIVASQKFDAEGNSYTWLYLTSPWIWLVGGIPMVGAYLAIILNAATVYVTFALGIGFCQKGFRYLK